MTKNTEKNDMLTSLFSRMTDEQLPASFRENIMRQVYIEAAKAKKRNERFALFSIIFASMIIVALAVFSILYLDLPKPEFTLPDLSSVPFYLYIGFLALLLLFADYKFRKSYTKRHLQDDGK